MGGTDQSALQVCVLCVCVLWHYKYNDVDCGNVWRDRCDTQTGVCVVCVLVVVVQVVYVFLFT